MRALKIDRDALLFPVAVAGRIWTAVFANGRGVIDSLRRGRDRRRLAEIVRGVEVFGPFHNVNMVKDGLCAKR